MFSAGAPDAGVVAPPLYLAAAERRLFEPAGGPGDPGHRAALQTYVSDLVRPHGLTPSDDRLAATAGRSYGDMAAALIAATVPADRPVDLLVLAMAVTDDRPGRATATYLSHVCPGGPLAFTVCDQGVVVAFTALMVTQEYAGSGGCGRGLIVVAEQSALPHDPAAPAELPARDAAVALLLETGVSETDVHRPRVNGVRLHADVAPDDVLALLRREAGSPEGSVGSTLVLGGGLAAYAESIVDDGRAVRVAPAGQPSAGVWWSMLDELSRNEPGELLVADYDPLVRCLGLASLTT
jgi:4-hydroxymandelate oxidase